MRWSGRDTLIVGLGIVVGVLGAVLWPKSSFEQCMLDLIHDPKKVTGAYWWCKGGLQKPPA